MSRRLLVVLGMMARCPFGGQTWLYLNWLRGLSRLGHDVWYVEDDSAWPYDPRVDSITDDPAYGAAHLDKVTRRIVKTRAVLAAMGGAVLETELQP